jgi:enamine deaminase RidA (YjgF/YER057c/UK114 family)
MALPAIQQFAFRLSANRYLSPIDLPPRQNVLPPMDQPGTKTDTTPASRTVGEPAKAGSRLRELGVVLPKPPSPLGAYVETSIVGSLLFVSGTLPLVDRKLAISGRIGRDLSVTQGQEAARLAALNALAAAEEHLGDLDKLKKLVKLTVLLTTTEDFTEHAAVADGASNLFVQLFGPEAGHVRVVYGVYSMPVGTPIIVETIFEV